MAEKKGELFEWLEWSEEAFEKAKKENKLVLVDVGAVWCHWCHVMDHTTYEDPIVAKLIKQYYVPVRVDRDERPDIDRRLQAFAEHGGWPLTVILTPDGVPIFTATYIPPEGMRRLLPAAYEEYQHRKRDFDDARHRLEIAFRTQRQAAGQKELSEAMVDGIVQQILHFFDPHHGGFGSEPKFPHPSAIDLLLAEHYVKPSSELLNVITTTLKGMAEGGIYDQIGGGFHRYSVDRRWHVPHFEKMAYDNAALLVNYVHAYKVTGTPLFKETALGIIRFTKEWLSDRERGGFYGSQDADIGPGDDGDYFTWTKDEMKAVLDDEEFKLATLYYDVDEAGDMHGRKGRNVLMVTKTTKQMSKILNWEQEKVEKVLASAKKKLLQERLKRKTPLVDKRLYADWNGMFIYAYLEAFKYLDLKDCKELALKSLERMLKEFMKDGRFVHTFNGKQPVVPTLADQAWMSLALLSAYEVTAERRYLEQAQKVMDWCLQALWDKEGGGFFDREQKESVLVVLTMPIKAIEDAPVHSANSIAALVLDRLYYLTQDDRWRDFAEATLKAFADAAPTQSLFFASWAWALRHHLQPPAKVVIIGKKGDEKTNALWQAALSTYRPLKLVQVLDPAQGNELPYPAAKDGSALAYICLGKTCAPPVKGPEELKETLTKFGLSKAAQ